MFFQKFRMSRELLRERLSLMKQLKTLVLIVSLVQFSCSGGEYVDSTTQASSEVSSCEVTFISPKGEIPVKCWHKVELEDGECSSEIWDDYCCEKTVDRCGTEYGEKT